MKNLTVILILILIVASCKKESIIKHDNYTIEFPMIVENATKIFDLTYGCYAGFFKYNVNSPELTIQLKNRPLFMGDDGIDEDYYKNENVTGITFFYNNDLTIADSIRRKCEKKYKIEFEQISVLEEMDYIEKTDTMTFLKSDIGNKITIIIKDIERKNENEKIVSLTYYYDLSDKELIRYVTWIK